MVPSKTQKRRLNSLFILRPLPSLYKRLNLTDLLPSYCWPGSLYKSDSVRDLRLDKECIHRPNIIYNLTCRQSKHSSVLRGSSSNPMPNANLCFWSSSTFPCLSELL